MGKNYKKLIISIILMTCGLGLSLLFNNFITILLGIILYCIGETFICNMVIKLDKLELDIKNTKKVSFIYVETKEKE